MMLNNKPSIAKLRWIMSELRDPETGCPWDIQQTFKSIVSHTIEEAYEVADAIEQGDLTELKKELGDLLFQVIFYSHLGDELQEFNFDDVVAAICEKLIRRHPHVFGEKLLTSDAEIKANWENEKIKERVQKAALNNEGNKLSILADIPKNLPALSQAMKIQKRCAHVGFDWHNIGDVMAKVAEEIDEVKAELEPANNQAINHNLVAGELGDLLFAVVNLCRHANADPETLLRQANRKFTKRFHGVEAQVAQSGKAFNEHDLEQLEQYWQHVKAQE
jgi:nucleoside triphosphate diphosphatase